ncbi:hypothetical protein UPYG_G00029480 [Umbra pygmaea]|uniref:CARD domain-containing protein n=1 Tax=Umbra pygmaea TaxID=75934 RepID=A0ABD0XPV3_UMBPY
MRRKRRKPYLKEENFTNLVEVMADKELYKARKLFIESVSKQVINQLLDDLFADTVLNEEEKDSVKEENNARAEQARCLIDMVRKKGSTASQKMIDHIKNRDPGLFEKLFE